jgi:hypothetical protein
MHKATKAGDDMLAPKLHETYRGASRHLLYLIKTRKDQIRQRKALNRSKRRKAARQNTAPASAVGKRDFAGLRQRPQNDP